MIFTPDDIRSRFREQPFQPVRIVTTTGQTYDIHHPDLVWPGRHFLMVGTPSPNRPDVPDLVTRIALVHLAEIRDLPTAPATGANGTAGG